MGYIPNAPQTNTGPQTQGAGADHYGSPMCLIIHQLSLSVALLHLFQTPPWRRTLQGGCAAHQALGQRPGDHCARMVSLEGQQGRRGATLHQMHGGHPHLPAKGL